MSHYDSSRDGYCWGCGQVNNCTCKKVGNTSKPTPNPPKVDNVKLFPNADVDPDIILGKAMAAGLTEVVILGNDKNGEFRFMGSMASGPKVLWMLEEAKQRLINIVLGL